MGNTLSLLILDLLTRHQQVKSTILLKDALNV